MTLEEIMKQWEADSQIDQVNLDNAVIETAKLHSKYLELLNVNKMKLKKRQYQMDILRKDKWMYFGGKMTKQQMDSKGWNYDPFDGCNKPLKNEMDFWMKADKEVQEMQTKIDYSQMVVDALIDIMENIKWRNQSIRNIIDWRRFTSGD